MLELCHQPHCGGHIGANSLIISYFSSMVESVSMEYRSLGRSGLKVSALAYGNMNSGMYQGDTEDWSFEVMKKAIDGGVNFIDTGEFYGNGMAERVLSSNLKRGNWPRDDLIISDKLLPVSGGIQGNSRKRIHHGFLSMLQRLDLTNIDVVFLHRYDHQVPLEETIRAVNWAIDEELCYYWGTSVFTPQQLVECHRICEKYGLIAPIVEQCEYNLVYRKEFEVDYAPLFDHYGMGSTIWSPLAGGFLTGRFNDGLIPDDSRIKTTGQWSSMFQEFHDEKLKICGLEGLKAMKTLADELDCSQAQLALAWTLKNKDVSTAIFGASKPSQVSDNLQSLKVLPKLTPEVLARIEGFMHTRPEPPTNWRTFAPAAPRR